MSAQPSVGTQRPPVQRVPSSGPHRPLNRPALPSKLSHVLASRQDAGLARNASRQGIITPSSSSQVPKPEHSAAQPEVIDLEDDTHNDSTASTRNTVAHTANGLLQYTPSTPQDRQNHIAPHTLQRQSPLPLPTRPACLVEPNQTRPPPSRTVSRKRADPARKPNGLRAPAMATSLPKGKVADFFPWTGISGMHPEDVLTEQMVKSGYSDKAPGPNSNESSMGKPGIHPNLRNKSGLHILSALLCQVMDKRQAMGRCTEASTFKPPPRVTLTDTKREAWLKDLAAPEVPLRKLSRTIPHGIRGKGLLDHCIAKEIPITRALWLSKCVGANEIRAFKRKGVSGAAALAGEIKWIREWTISVEQFVDGVIASCGQPGWNQKMNYAIRLATHFYSEHLLDAEHYMDWLIGSLTSSTSERLPIWILLVQIYWKHLISERRRGSKLALALLIHAQSLADAQHASVNAQLVSRLNQLIIVLAVAHQGCLVLPSSWITIKPTFSTITPAGKYEFATRAMHNVIKRNDRLCEGGITSTSTSQNAKLQLINILDSVELDVQLDRLATNCRSLRLDMPDVLKMALEWACSKHRYGLSKIYLVASLLRYWNGLGIDTEHAILAMLEHASATQDHDARLLHKIAAVLSGSGHFSVGRYLQWLISMGALSGMDTTSTYAQLLLELPDHHLSHHVLSLRRTILNRMRYSVDAEKRQIESYKIELCQSLGEQAVFALPPDIPGTVKSAIAEFLCQRVIYRSPQTGATTFVGTVASYCLIRHTLEGIEDFTSLGNIIIAASSSADPQLLATVSDTVNLHADIFAALGLLPDLTAQLCNQQRVLRAMQPLDRTFLLSLSSLARRVSSAIAFVKPLANDVAVCEMQNSAAACSPASDNMIVSVAGVLESDIDIDRVLASGNTMDEQLMARMFALISSQIAKTGIDVISRASGWFSQLRLFDPTTFDQLCQHLVFQTCNDTAKIQHFHNLAAALVGSGNLLLDAIFQTYERKINNAQISDTAQAGRLATACTRMMIPFTMDGDVAYVPEVYRLELARTTFCEQNKSDVFRIVCIALSMSSGSTNNIEAIGNDDLLPLLGHYVVKATDVVAREFIGKSSHSPAGLRCQELINTMLCADDIVQNNTNQPVARISRVVSSANELSLKISQLVIQQCSLSLQNGGTVSEDDKVGLLETFQTAIDADSSVWPTLLGSLDKDMISQIHGWAQERLTNSISTLVSATTAAADYSVVKRYLKVWEVSASATRLETPDIQVFTALTEHLKDMSSLAETIYTLDTTPLGQGARIGFGVEVLLKLVTTHYQSLGNSRSSQEFVPLLTVLCSLLVHPRLQTQLQLLEHILDVTSMISDDIPVETLQSMVKQFPGFARNNPRIRYLFGSTTNSDSWLALASRIYTQSSAAQQPTGNAFPTTSSLPRPPASLPPRPGSLPQRPSGIPGSSQTPGQASQVQRQPPTPGGRGPFEIKTQPFQLRRWEIMPDPTPNMGANDTSLSLGLFQAKKCL